MLYVVNFIKLRTDTLFCNTNNELAALGKEIFIKYSHIAS
jgi:hypothetical protein